MRSRLDLKTKPANMQRTLPLNRFALKKNAYGSLVVFNRVPYMQLLHMIPGVNIIGRKVSVASVNEAWGSGGVLRPQWGP